MSNKIQADYDQLSSVCSSFSQQSSNCSDTFQRLNAALSNLQGGGWIGEGASAFYAEMDDLVTPATRRLIDALSETSNCINQIAQLLQEAENGCCVRIRTKS